MQAVLETDEQLKIRKKGMGSKNHSLIQLALITQMVLNYNQVYKAVPELSLDFNGKEKIPDLSIYPKDSIAIGKDEIRVKNMPLVVVEILSPKQVLSDLVEKSEIYFGHQIPSYWLVIPELQSIYVYYSADQFEIFSKKDILKDKVLNIELDLSQVF